VTHRVDLTPEAEADIAEAYEWYAERSVELGADFLDRLNERIATIATHPEGYQLVHRTVRRALLRRFPYCLYYVVESDRVVVVGCFHARRDPRKWQLRANA